MIVLMLTKELRKILADGEVDARVIDAQLNAVNMSDSNKTVDFNIGCGILTVPWFNMSGNSLAWEDIVTPCVATLKCDDLNPDIFTIRSIKPIGSDANLTVEEPYNPPFTPEELKQPEEETSTTNTAGAESNSEPVEPSVPDCGKDKTEPTGGSSKTPYKGCSYSPKVREW